MFYHTRFVTSNLIGPYSKLYMTARWSLFYTHVYIESTVNILEYVQLLKRTCVMDYFSCVSSLLTLTYEITLQD